MVFATWQLVTVQLVPHGTDVTVHVVKKNLNHKKIWKRHFWKKL